MFVLCLCLVDVFSVCVVFGWQKIKAIKQNLLCAARNTQSAPGAQQRRRCSGQLSVRRINLLFGTTQSTCFNQCTCSWVSFPSTTSSVLFADLLCGGTLLGPIPTR